MFKYFILISTVFEICMCFDKMPPTTGKFFYTDFLSEGIHGVHYIDFLIGNKSREYHKFSVSTSEHEIGVYTTRCPIS